MGAAHKLRLYKIGSGGREEGVRPLLSAHDDLRRGHARSCCRLVSLSLLSVRPCCRRAAAGPPLRCCRGAAARGAAWQGAQGTRVSLCLPPLLPLYASLSTPRCSRSSMLSLGGSEYCMWKGGKEEGRGIREQT